MSNRISPYTRLLNSWRDSVRKMFVANVHKKAIVQMPADDFMRGAIASAERLGYVCIAKVEGSNLVVYAREAIKGSDMPYDVRPDWTTKEVL